MGLGGISIWQLLIILVIVVLIFGTKRLKGMGSDLGGAVKGFKDAVSPDDETEVLEQKKETADQGTTQTKENAQQSNGKDDKTA